VGGADREGRLADPWLAGDHRDGDLAVAWLPSHHPEKGGECVLAAGEAGHGGGKLAGRPGRGRCPVRLARGRERRVGGQDRPFEPLQVRAWFESQLLGENGTGVTVDPQRLALAAGAVERQHQLGAEALMRGVASDQGVELTDQFAVTAAGEVRLDARLQAA
jgi:hypothetical protein